METGAAKASHLVVASVDARVRLLLDLHVRHEVNSSVFLDSGTDGEF